MGRGDKEPDCASKALASASIALKSLLLQYRWSVHDARPIEQFRCQKPPRNQYAYAVGDPVNNNDPSGLDEGPPEDGPGPQGPNVPQPNQPSGREGGTGPGAMTAWNSLSKNCQDALKTAMPKTSVINMLQALGRANADESTFQSATAGTNVSWIMLAATAIRESGVQDLNESDGAGVGVGVFQITVNNNNQNPANGPTSTEANNLSWAAGFAANLLNTDMTQLANKFPNFTPTQLLQATFDAYNMGIKNISGNPATMDVGSAKGNYGSNVLQLMDCFH
jgi:hypothetical protein